MSGTLVLAITILESSFWPNCAPPVAQMVKNLHAMHETSNRSLDLKDSLGRGMATHSSFLAWKIPWTEEPGAYSPQGYKELDTTE